MSEIKPRLADEWWEDPCKDCRLIEKIECAGAVDEPERCMHKDYHEIRTLRAALAASEAEVEAWQAKWDKREQDWQEAMREIREFTYGDTEMRQYFEMRNRAESAESLCTTFENALKAIATAGTSMPAVDNDEVGHYRSVAYSLIGIASDALLERGKL